MYLPFTDDLAQEKNARCKESYEQQEARLHKNPSNQELDCEEEFEQKNEDPATAVSIDVTKALLLLGVNCWSNLEPGK